MRPRSGGRQEQQLDLTIEVADCQDLHYGDASFDVVSSSVGVIFAPDHERVASELARVCRPGGRVGLTAWRRESGVGAMFSTISAFMPPPPEGAGSPFQWGDEGYVESRLGGDFDLSFEERDSRHRAGDGSEIWNLYKSSYGPFYTLSESLDDDRKAELDEAMVGFYAGYRDGDGIDMERRFIVITGTRKE